MRQVARAGGYSKTFTLPDPLSHPPPSDAGPESGPEMTWEEYERAVESAAQPYAAHCRECSFFYRHLSGLQPRTPERFKGDYSVKIGYLEWGDVGKPLVVCLGGVVNVAQRFNNLAMELKDHYHVVCPDWVGRGGSGWLRDEGDYGFGTYVEQTRQLLAHLGGRPAILLGSSLGGSVAIALAHAFPQQISKLILNDVGPHIATARRRRRAEILVRHYVFGSPAELLRKTGAAQKNDGMVSQAMRLLLSHRQTAWCNSHEGRVYRHDIRALQAYQREAVADVDQWKEWGELACPVLLIHGMQSDVLLPADIARMQAKSRLTLMHIPGAGHTPALTEPSHVWLIEQWLGGSPMLGAEFSSLMCASVVAQA